MPVPQTNYGSAADDSIWMLLALQAYRNRGSAAETAASRWRGCAP